MKERNPAIFDEWDRIVSRDRSRNGTYSPDAGQAWLRLWNQYVADGALAHTNLEDSGLICSLGWQLAIHAKDFPAAVKRIDTWFEHPDVGIAGEIDIGIHRSSRALANLLGGNLDSAIAEYRDLLRNPQAKHPNINRSCVRNHLWEYCRELRRRKRVPGELRDLVVETMLLFPGKKRIARSIDSDSATYRDLFAALDSTYPA